MEAVTFVKGFWTAGVQDSVVAWLVVGVLGFGLIFFWSWTKRLAQAVANFANKKVAVHRWVLLLIAVVAAILSFLPMTTPAWVSLGLAGLIVFFCFYVALSRNLIVNLRIPPAALASPPPYVPTDAEKVILSDLLKLPSSQWVSSPSVAERIGMSEQLVAHTLDQLVAKKMLVDSYNGLTKKAYRFSELGRACALSL